MRLSSRQIWWRVMVPITCLSILLILISIAISHHNEALVALVNGQRLNIRVVRIVSDAYAFEVSNESELQKLTSSLPLELDYLDERFATRITITIVTSQYGEASHEAYMSKEFIVYVPYTVNSDGNTRYIRFMPTNSPSFWKNHIAP
jgi:hypothetical protein